MGTRRKLFVSIFLFFIVSSFQYAVFSSDSGSTPDDKIGGMTEDIKKKEKERKEKEKEKEHQNKKDDEKATGDSCGGEALGDCFGSCFANIFPLIIDYAASIEYAEYPYAESGDFVFSQIKSDKNKMGKIGYLRLAYEPAYLWDNVWGMSGRIVGALSILVADCMFQYNFNDKNRFGVASLNAGLQFPISNFSLSFFAGGFRIFLPEPDIATSIIPSFGGSLQIFFPNNVAFEIYNLDAISDPLWFVVITTSICVEIGRFALGAGFDYYDYAGTVYMGPSLELSIWI